MNKKLIIIALLALLVISFAGYSYFMPEGHSFYLGCKAGFTITNDRPVAGYQVIKVTCNFAGYNPPFPGLDYWCGETNQCE